MSDELDDIFDAFTEDKPKESTEKASKETKDSKSSKKTKDSKSSKKTEKSKTTSKSGKPTEESSDSDLDDILGPSEDTPKAEEEEKEIVEELDDILGPSEDTPQPEKEPVNKPEESSDPELDDIFGDDEENVDEPETKAESVPKPKTKVTKVEKVTEEAPTDKRSSTTTPVSITQEMLEELIADEDYDIRTEEVKDEEDRTVYCLIGDKGTSKTTTAMSYDKSELPDDDLRKGDGTIMCCISLDRQSNKIANKYRKAYRKKYPEKPKLVKMRKAAKKKAKRKKLDHKHPEQIAVVEKYCKNTDSEKWGYIHTHEGVQGVKEIHVWDGVYYYTTEKPYMKTLSAEATYMYLLRLLDNVIAPMNPDYIILDDMEKLNVICEMTMRKRNGMSAHEGFKNRNLWKERNDYIDHIFGRCVDHSRVAPIFTTYFKMQEIEDKATGVKNVREPAWVDRVKKETNTIIHLDYGIEDGKNVWYGTVQSAKDPGWKDEKFNVYTDYEGNGGIRNLMIKHEVFIQE